MNYTLRKSGVVLFVLFSLAQVSCDAWSDVCGHIYDSQNKPIENATVQFSIAGVKENKELFSETVKTDKNGYYKVRVGHGTFGTNLRLIVAKDGYKISETEFSAKDVQNNRLQYEDYKIVLDKIE